MASERKYGGYTLEQLDGTPLVKGAFEPIIEDFVDRIRELEAALSASDAAQDEAVKEANRLTAANASLTAERDGAQEQCQRLERALLDTEAERDGYRADALLAWPSVPIERGQTVLVAIHGSNGQPYAQWFDYNPDPFPRAFHHCPAESAAAALQALKEKMEKA